MASREAHVDERQKVVFLCKGSRGDVHPLLSIALAYKKEYKSAEVVLVCAPSSIGGLETILSREGLSIIELPQQKISSLSDAHRLVSDAERLSLLKSEAGVCLAACHGADLIVFNLFSLEGYFIALHLSIPCLAASPHILNRGPPFGFDAKLSEAYPDLYQKLKEAKDSGSDEAVSYSEVEHWMWRLFLDDYGEVCQSLGLSDCVPFPSAQSLPPPTSLLYGISPTLLPRQPYWPMSVQLSGFWTLHPSLCPMSPDPSLASLVEQLSSSPLLYVGFGSMETFMLDIKWEALFDILDSALQQVQFQAIFQCQPDGTVHKAYTKLPQKPELLHFYRGEVPHGWLFQRCSAVLHHGGSGTVATALLARKPQIICPVMFDQEFWAEQLSWRELAVRCSSPKLLKEDELVGALRATCSRVMRERIEEVACDLEKEDAWNSNCIELYKKVIRKTGYKKLVLTNQNSVYL